MEEVSSMNFNVTYKQEVLILTDLQMHPAHSGYPYTASKDHVDIHRKKEGFWNSSLTLNTPLIAFFRGQALVAKGGPSDDGKTGIS